jgi:NADH-quinone oxidoreductase subunit N
VSAIATMHGPGGLDYEALSPFFSLAFGAILALMVGLLRPAWVRKGVVPGIAVAFLLGAVATTIWQFNRNVAVIDGALRVDDLALVIGLMLYIAGIGTVVMSLRSRASRGAGHGEYHALLLSAILGMEVLAAAQNVVVLFVGYELLSISLYVLCATEYRRATSLEAGLKYLIIGSVGAAVLLYGLGMIYGATGQTGFHAIAHALAAPGGLRHDVLTYTGIALVVVGLAFKTSVAPFHQWTPDVYEGAPTPITAFMSTATKAAAFAVFLRFFDVALIGSSLTWAPWVAALATATIFIGNVGGLSQTSVKRMLGYSGVAQAGYMLAGVVVSSKLGVQATVYYLFVYTFMNLCAFAVVAARERETGAGDDLRALAGLGRERPWLAWSMTVAMLSLAGIPATAGFTGKFYLIEACVDGGYTWLGIIIVIGAVISLGYYLRVVVAVWMRRSTLPATPSPAPVPAPGGGPPRPAIAGGSSEADRRRPHIELVVCAVAFAAASVFFGIIASPLFHLTDHAAAAVGNLF